MEPQITVGLLTDAGGAPLMLDAFEGNTAETKTMIPLIRDFVPATEFVSYLEACLRVYNRYGRRDNIYKARIKILVHEIGADEYRRQVEEEFLHVKTLALDPPATELDRIAAGEEEGRALERERAGGVSP